MIPIVERIRANIISSLSGISIAGGYENDVIVEALNEENNDSNRWRDGLILVWEFAEETDEAPLGSSAYWQPFGVGCIAIETRASGVQLETRCALIAADVEKRLAGDRTRGGIAIWTEFDPFQIRREGQRAMALVKPRVRYRTAFNNRYSQTAP